MADADDQKKDLLQSLSTQAARQLATVTKSAPQMQGITSRWLSKVLPWVQIQGGVYRVNRRLILEDGDNNDDDNNDDNKKRKRKRDKYGQAAVDLLSGHFGEPKIPDTFADYDIGPREYELSVAQTVLHVHTRVADLYNEPMSQIEEQLKLVIEELRERQEDEMINNDEFGLLHQADDSQRFSTHSGPPTPDDLDELLTRRRNPQYLLAHPKAIAAFGREANRRGLYPESIDIGGNRVPTWRGIPLLPCSKIPIVKEKTSEKASRKTSIIVIRTGEDNEGVIGLQPAKLPDEYEPGLNVRFMGINEKALISYLVSAYYSVAVLVPDAVGILEDVELGHRYRD